MHVARRIVNDVSYVTRIKDQTLFTWRAQYLVRLEGDACCSAHDVSYATRTQDKTLFTWQAQHLVRLEGDACCSAHCK